MPKSSTRYYSYHSSHLERCCRFSTLNSGCRGAAVLVVTGRFEDIRRVRLSNRELGTRSARTRSAKLSYCSSHPE
eukprot:2247285-Pyramimonas_sp.AAC.1